MYTYKHIYIWVLGRRTLWTLVCSTRDHNMNQSKLKETISRKHKMTKTYTDAATVTPLQDLPSCMFLPVYYLDPRLFIHRSLMKHRELRCILGGFYLMACLLLMNRC